MNVAKPIQVNWAEALTPLIPTGSHPWGVSVEVSGLEVVLSAEQWGGSDMIALLETHVEPDPFLDDYRRRVIRDLKGE